MGRKIPILNEVRLTILQAAADHGSLYADTAASELETDPAGARRLLRRMADDGLLVEVKRRNRNGVLRSDFEITPIGVAWLAAASTVLGNDAA